MLTKLELYKNGKEKHLHIFVNEDITFEMINDYLYNLADSVTEFVFIVSDRMVLKKLAHVVKLLRNTYILVKYNLFIMSDGIPLQSGIFDYVLIADGYNKIKTVYMKVGGDEWNPAFADITAKYMLADNNLLEKYDNNDRPKYYKIDTE